MSHASPNVSLTSQADSPPPWHLELASLLQRFWELEDVPQAHRQAPNDVECERSFADHGRAEDGRYVVRLPLKQGGLQLLGDSCQSALASLTALQHQLQRAPEMAVEYTKFMADYLALGHMRPLTSAQLAGSSHPAHYIQHHSIWQHSDQGQKLRVVFNASHPTSSGCSLNDVLHAGPRLQTALPHVLLRWRRHRIAFCSDVQMMFRQIWIDDRDVDLQRIVWSADPREPPTHYQLLTVTYGASCSPYLSLRTIQQLCEDEGSRWPDAVPVVMRDRYVDDILSGADSLDTARHLRDQLIGLMQAGGFPLRKWVASTPELLEDLLPDVRLRPAWDQLGAEGLVSELGVGWDPPVDRLRLTPVVVQRQTTKRTMLAALASVFDPCGWLAPITLNAKLLLQDLWRAHLDWDETVPSSMVRRWMDFVSELQIDQEGIIRGVDFELKDCEILQDMTSSAKIHCVKRINGKNPMSSKDQGQPRYIPTKSVVISFQGQDLSKCGKDKHEDKCTEKVRCASCNGDHPALASSCPTIQKERAIQRVIAY
ncbi:uncharacterized protein LOC106644791 [Copidosoma floridanum]|uniref:uncharacterized protein LOC106644791 n=1 Tax=Copidosoma floridanum TaxID=29053 RepID=UPI000C6F7612|nr:uncharacterized protein LOC106644791 [Copidosoma floridanum]